MLQQSGFSGCVGLWLKIVRNAVALCTVLACRTVLLHGHLHGTSYPKVGGCGHAGNLRGGVDCCPSTVIRLAQVISNRLERMWSLLRRSEVMAKNDLY